MLQQGAAGKADGTQQWLANPALPDDILREAVPGNIRRAGESWAGCGQACEVCASRLLAWLAHVAGSRLLRRPHPRLIPPSPALLPHPPAEHFVAFLQRFVQHLRSRLAVNEVVSVTPTAFLEKLQEVGAQGGLGCAVRSAAW